MYLGFRQRNQEIRKKGNKGNLDWKEEIQLYLFIDNMIICVESSIEQTKKLLKLISEFSKAAG